MRSRDQPSRAQSAALRSYSRQPSRSAPQRTRTAGAVPGQKEALPLAQRESPGVFDGLLLLRARMRGGPVDLITGVVADVVADAARRSRNRPGGCPSARNTRRTASRRSRRPRERPWGVAMGTRPTPSPSARTNGSSSPRRGAARSDRRGSSGGGVERLVQLVQPDAATGAAGEIAGKTISESSSAPEAVIAKRLAERRNRARTCAPSGEWFADGSAASRVDAT